MIRLGPWALEVTPSCYCVPVYSTTTDHSSSYKDTPASDGSLNVNHTVQVHSAVIPWLKVTSLSATASELSPDMFTAE